MMTNPSEFLEAFRRAGADWISVHVEVGGRAELIAEMRKLGNPGLALTPRPRSTPSLPGSGASTTSS